VAGHNLPVLIEHYQVQQERNTTFASIAGEKYAAIGTSQGLFIYYNGQFYDITPLDTAITGADFDATTGSATVTVNKTAHGLAVGTICNFF
jgi:hypothetical protein